MSDKPPHSYLRRLAPEHYQGHTYVHWAMTIKDRSTGWLNDSWHRTFRELLVHTLGKHHIVCPAYCLMPDHVHLLWIGYQASSDQKPAIKRFRSSTNKLLLRPADLSWQKQPFDHVLRPVERERGAFEKVAGYILANPVRQGLVTEDAGSSYPFTGCLVPGYPDLNVWQDDYWDLFWRLYWRLADACEE